MQGERCRVKDAGWRLQGEVCRVYAGCRAGQKDERVYVPYYHVPCYVLVVVVVVVVTLHPPLSLLPHSIQQSLHSLVRIRGSTSHHLPRNYAVGVDVHRLLLLLLLLVLFVINVPNDCAGMIDTTPVTHSPLTRSLPHPCPHPCTDSPTHPLPLSRLTTGHQLTGPYFTVPVMSSGAMYLTFPGNLLMRRAVLRERPKSDTLA